MKLEPRSDIIRRLRCAAGHLEAVIQMTEDGESCEKVIFQLAAVNAALRAAENQMLLCQAQASQTVILESSAVEERSAELQRLQKVYMVLLQNSARHYEVSHE